ncbi:MAG TPA: hypothetical protein VNT20_21155 [Flavisolibacter sp.]|nr:hypothetical protein [Flavisolibacter sp.]
MAFFFIDALTGFGPSLLVDWIDIHLFANHFTKQLLVSAGVWNLVSVIK